MADGTLVVQSAPATRPAWVERCLDSVRRWAADAGHAHELVGDELLDAVPAWVHEAADGVLPVTDVGRLLLLIDRLGAGWGRVVWLDADVVVFDPSALEVAVPAPLAACREVWVTGAPGGGLQALELVCNAGLSATSAAAVEHLLARTLDAARAGPTIGDRALGPDLLTRLHRRAPLPLIPGLTLLSPLVVADVAGGGGPAVARHLTATGERLGAANLCGSLASDEAVLEGCIDVLTDRGRLPGG